MKKTGMSFPLLPVSNEKVRSQNMTTLFLDLIPRINRNCFD